MADTKTSAETAATTPTGAELVRIVQGGSSKKTTLAVAGHQFRGARVRMTTDDTTQNVTAGAAISFDSAEFDTDSFWAAGTPTRLTIPAGLGITHVEATGQANVSAGTADTWRSLSIQHWNSVDAAQHTVGQRQVEGGATGGALSVSTGPLEVADGDYFVLLLQEESDNSITIEGDSGSVHTFLALKVLGMEPV